ncbi:hypothetical protein PIB30_061542, partial [Stylosanthes scabra]|nr:hypothetical protein [Stylosanthes scabra]
PPHEPRTCRGSTVARQSASLVHRMLHSVLVPNIGSEDEDVNANGEADNGEADVVGSTKDEDMMVLRWDLDGTGTHKEEEEEESTMTLQVTVAVGRKRGLGLEF